MNQGDYDGAITNARSLVEAVLAAIEKEFDANPPDYDGDLPKLYKRVQKHLNRMLVGIQVTLTDVIVGGTTTVPPPLPLQPVSRQQRARTKEQAV